MTSEERDHAVEIANTVLHDALLSYTALMITRGYTGRPAVGAFAEVLSRMSTDGIEVICGETPSHMTEVPPQQQLWFRLKNPLFVPGPEIVTAIATRAKEIDASFRALASETSQVVR